MKNKNLLILLLLGVSVVSGFSQTIPSYVPKTGLVGWWPFNGNANDESGNGNNGTVNGATLTSDRFGSLNSAFSFNNSSQNHINIPYKSSLTNWVGTLSLWLNTTSTFGNEQRFLFGQPYGQPQLTINGNYCNNSNLGSIYFSNLNPSGDQGICSNTKLNNGNWQHIVALYSLDSMKIFINGILQNAIFFKTPLNPNICNASLGIGGYNTPAVCGFSKSAGQFFNGIIDDIGIWNRALDSNEIKKLYTGCMRDEITTEPSNASKATSSSTKFDVTAKSGSTFQWQSNQSSLGWVNIPSNSIYSGVTSASLNVSNLSVSNHKQQFRAIVTNSPCKDTSKVVEIIITDTCINTKSVSVADTLKFAVNLTGVAPPNNRNAMKVYPNPTNSAVVIDNGNYTAMSNYIVKIENSIGQQVFFSKVNQQQFVVDVSTLGGKGVYTLSVLDSVGKLLETKMIVLQ
jgi:hypothetical protein